MTARSLAPPAVEPSETRYQVERKIGEGAAGAVYLVRDRETGEQLALKKLFRVDAKTVLRLKREFRSLQAINHPHIIKLYDMGQAGDAWFLTMEYLDGKDLTSHLNSEQRGAANIRQNTTRTTLSSCSPRLISVFGQLARGVHALHEAGMLHRDLKPSNVLVVGHRVVVLDFGLVRELSMTAATLSEDGAVAGTPAYMAPEQIMAKELTAATDWYAFGAMLYEAVSGLLPLDGPLMDLMRQKLEREPLPLQRVAADVPRWLSDLCTGLLRIDPAQRPSGAEVLAQFEAAAPQAVPLTGTDNVLPTEVESHSTSGELVGRAAEIKQLWKALAQAEDGRAVVVHVRGLSGTGKSALVEHFLDQIGRSMPGATSSDALVLRSRCYELEAMPFKALDGVMDALVRHLAYLDDFEVAHLLPTDIPALAQVFPVLERLNAVKRLLSTKKPMHDALQTRRVAEVALRALLDNLAARAPIVVWIDDLQWGDLDSARILRNWLVQPSTAPILFVFSYRSDEVETSTCLRKLLHVDTERSSQAPEHVIEIVPLAGADIHALCEQRLGLHTAAREELIERVVREAQGSPFLASQLIALANAKSVRGDTDLNDLSLDLMVAQTGAMLAEDAKQLLAVLAVAGRPMPPKLALQAARVKRGGRALVHDLRGLNLVRTRDVGGTRMLEVYHDRVRERVAGALSVNERRLLHDNLLQTVELSGQGEPDWLHALALGAGQDVQALHYGSAAAERANASLAFERAAGLYRKCIELVPAHESGALWSKLSLALARCGHGVQAAEASLEAGKHVAPDERVAWIHRAASHLLRSGHFTQGEALVRQVLEAKKIAVPTSDAGLIAAIVWERTRIGLRGANDALRADAQILAGVLERVDLLASLYRNVGMYDPLRGALFQARSLRSALDAGEPNRLVRALCAASISAAVAGSARAAHESDAFVARADAINSKLPTPDNQMVCYARAVSAFNLGRLHQVLEPSREAERWFRADSQNDPIGNYFARLAVASVRIGALHFFGQYRELTVELKGVLDEARATDNRVVALQLAYSETLLEQIEGQVARSRARLDAQRTELPTNCVGHLHILHMIAVMSTACWTGEYAWARDYLAHAWPQFLRSPVRRAAYLALMAHTVHIQFTLNQHIATGRNGDPARATRKDLRALQKLPLPLASTSAHRYRARLALLTNDTERAIAELRVSAAGHQQIGMPHEVARDEYALGALLQGNEGTALRSAAEQRIADLGVVDPSADLRAHFPELFEVG